MIMLWEITCSGGAALFSGADFLTAVLRLGLVDFKISPEWRCCLCCLLACLRSTFRRLTANMLPLFLTPSTSCGSCPISFSKRAGRAGPDLPYCCCRLIAAIRR